MIKLLDQIDREMACVFQPQDQRSVWAWAEDEINLSIRQTESAGPYSTLLTPYIREPLECFKDPAITDLTLCFGSQTSKTTALMIGCAWRIKNRPCPAIWVMPTENLARSFSENRWQPMINDCGVLRDTKTRESKKFKTLEMVFQDCVLTFVGSNSPASLASRPAGLLIMDEIDKFARPSAREAGAVQLAENRTKTYANPLRAKSSTPTTKDGEIWNAFMNGDQRYYYVPCPHCEKKQRLVWPQVKWESDKKEEEDIYDYERVLKTAYYECMYCKGQITNGHKTSMLRSGEWIAHNPRAAYSARSYHLNSLYAPWKSCGFGELAVKFLQDKNSLLGLQDFVNSILAEPWAEQEVQDIEIQVGAYSLKEMRPDEKIIMSVDVQESKGFHTWVVVRGWKSNGESRLIWCGRIESWGDLVALQQEYSIKSTCVFVDSGDQTRMVYEQCCKNGWIALFGSDQSGFAELINGHKVSRPFVRIASGDPFSGKMAGSKFGWKWRLCPVWRWSNPTIKDVLHNLLKTDGFIAIDTPEVWHSHIRAEIKKLVRNPATGRSKMMWKQISKDSHLRDCECMNIVGAALHKLVNITTSEIKHDEVLSE